MFVELPFSSKIVLKLVTKLVTSVGISSVSFLLVCLDTEELLEEHADKININSAAEIITENFFKHSGPPVNM